MPQAIRKWVDCGISYTYINNLGGYYKTTAAMRQIITTFIFILSTLICFGQKIEPNFIDNFKTSKWKSLDNFSDSTILKLKELKLTRWNPANDSLKYFPTLWIFNDGFKIKYYYNTTITRDSIITNTKTNFNVLNCTYSYDNGKGELTIILDNKDKSTLTFKTAIISSGSFILLTRKK
jgi:hypothetical protein